VSALSEIIPRLPKIEIPYTVLVVIHMSVMEALETMTRRFDELSQLDVKIAEHGMPIEPNTVYLYPIKIHGGVTRQVMNTIATLKDGPKVNFVKPSIDVLMKSVAEAYRDISIGVQLTGMGRDGADGMKTIKHAGGLTIAQDETTSSVFSMPRAAIELDCVDRILPIQKVADEIMAFVEEKSKDLDMALHLK
jgi:two-component system chemotaxis response regulator CheB